MVHKKTYQLIISICVFLCLLSSCKEDAKVHSFVKKYDGPLVILDSVNTLYSDSTTALMRLQALEQLEFQNGDREFPKGVLIFFYDKKGNIESKLTSKKGKFVKLTNVFTATGNVVVENIIEKKRLNTELLNWNSKTKRVYTDKFVKIQTQQDVLYGTGLESDETFSNYTILNPSGFGTSNSF